MAGITRRRFDQPDELYEMPDGSRTEIIALGDDAMVMRSTMQPGWSWFEQFGEGQPGATCPMHHRETIVSGRIRYLTSDGTELVGEAGDYLEILPGHLAWVVGDEPCVAIDW